MNDKRRRRKAMKSTFCTIVDRAYVPFAMALYQSLARQRPDARLTVLVTDGVPEHEPEPGSGIEMLGVDGPCGSGSGRDIYEKYFHTARNTFRWSMKPVLVDHLLNAGGLDRVIYLDSDMWCCGDYQFLFDKLSRSHVILTPHWRPVEAPEVNAASSRAWDYLLNFRDGFFNGGLVGASRAGAPAMRWWAKACAFRCERHYSLGLYDDQRYLDMLASLFEGVEVIRHRGCNIAGWNRLECERTQAADGRILINGDWDAVFVHFAISTIRSISLGRDPLLRPLFDEYLECLASHGVTPDSALYAATIGAAMTPKTSPAV
jgi:hypothetical protein